MILIKSVLFTLCATSFSLFIIISIFNQQNFETLEPSLIKSSREVEFYLENLQDSSQVYLQKCDAQIVETIPDIGLQYDSNQSIRSISTFDAFIELISRAQTSIEIASNYFKFLGPENEAILDVEGHLKGKYLMDRLINVTKANKDLELKVVVQDKTNTSYNDLRIIESIGKVKQINLTHLLGSGILHSKFMIIDRKHFYLGSASFGYPCFSNKIELGIYLSDCSSLANDLAHIFDIYWNLENYSKDIKLTESKPAATQTNSLEKEREPNYLIKSESDNKLNHLIQVNDSLYDMNIASSPSILSRNGRTSELDAILSLITNAKHFIHIFVTDYLPLFLYTGKDETFWPVIDDAIKTAIINHDVEIKLLATNAIERLDVVVYLRSLAALSDNHMIKGSIQVKLLDISKPDDLVKHNKISYNHGKYMITDEGAMIGTSNWSGDYFDYAAGVCLVIKPRDNTTSSSHLIQHLSSIYQRDWNSIYAKTIK